MSVSSNEVSVVVVFVKNAVKVLVLQVINYLMFFMFVEFFPLLLGKVPAFKWI